MIEAWRVEHRNGGVRRKVRKDNGRDLRKMLVKHFDDIGRALVGEPCRKRGRLERFLGTGDGFAHRSPLAHLRHMAVRRGPAEPRMSPYADCRIGTRQTASK